MTEGNNGNNGVKGIEGIEGIEGIKGNDGNKGIKGMSGTYTGRDFLYGAAYYYEYQLPEEKTGLSPDERMRTDFQMMKKAGMNVIRIAESTWSTIEPREGVFCFDHIDRMLQAAKEAELKVIVGTPTYAVPAWMAKSYPDVMAERKDGGRVFYGPRQVMDILNPDYRRLSARVIEKLAAHVAQDPSVIGYQLDNETKHYDCFSACAQEKFKAHMREKFGTVQKLNEAYGLAYWSNSIAGWDDFPDIRNTINAGLGTEYKRFMRFQAAEFLKWQAELVRAHARADQFITHNFDFGWRVAGTKGSRTGYSYGVQPGICHAQAASALDAAGGDIYHPTQDALTGREIAFGGDSLRSLKDHHYFVLETEAQGFKEWTPYPGQLMLHAMSHAACGASMIGYWNWNSLHNSFETYWKGVLSHDLAENRILREIGVIGSALRKLWPQIRGLRKKNRIALLICNEAQTALDEFFPVDSAFSYNDAVRWIYDALYDLNLECDILDVKAVEEKPERLDRCRMLVTPVLYTCSDQLVSLLRGYVKAGGTLVSTFKSFFADENMTVRPELQPCHMTDVFGVCYQEFTQAWKLRAKGKKCRYFAELLEKTGGCEPEILASYEHPFWGSYAAASKNHFGEGNAYYIASRVAKSVLKEFLMDAARAAGIGLPSERWPVTVRSLEDEEGRRARFILHYSGSSEKWLSSCSGVELLSGRSVWKGELLELEPWSTLVIMER